MAEELQPKEILARAKKNQHHYAVVSQAFTLAHRDFIIYNLSLKKDYEDEFDYVNFRRGLAYQEEIIDFKHTPLKVARKGLRKFKDLYPEYLEIKDSHISNSKYHEGEKERIFEKLLKSNAESYLIYNTEKLNGENAQISYSSEGVWIIGSKNKTLMVSSPEDLSSIKNKHEHKLTTLIAQAWFAMLLSLGEEKTILIKERLVNLNMIGQYCNSDNLQHLVHYGKGANLFFYALVNKDDFISDCLPTSNIIHFCQEFSLPCAKYSIHPTTNVKATLEKMKELIFQINELPMKEGGEGSVIYVTALHQNTEHNLLVGKVKTIEYRIYRKLREKLKVYLEKFNKGYEKLHKKFIEEVQEISKGFTIHERVEQYYEIAKKAFVFCSDQNKPLSRLISNRYIDFLAILQRKDITKEMFLTMLKQGQLQSLDPEEKLIKPEEEVFEEPSFKEKLLEPLVSNQIKRVLVLVPLTIPSTGKSSLFGLIQKIGHPQFDFWSISSDEIKRKVMDQKMKKMKNMTKEKAFENSRKEGNERYYLAMNDVFKQINQSEKKDHVFLLDKNHPENSLKETIKQLQDRSRQFEKLHIKIVALLPETDHSINLKGKFSYPYSSCYILTCLKRILAREEHETLEGTEVHRCSIVLAFTNLFRNFTTKRYNLEKYFASKAQFQFTNDKVVVPQKIQESLLKVLLGGKPGNFDYVDPHIEELIQEIKQWKNEENGREASAIDAMKKIEAMFNTFEEMFEGETEDK